jgi:hypothetical protein
MIKSRCAAQAVFVAVSLAAMWGSRSAHAQAKEKEVIDSFISKRTAKEQAEEYEDARHVVKADVNADKKIDLVVLYSLEGFGGGNNYNQYLAVFLGKGNTFQYAAGIAVGGKLRRDVDLKSVTVLDHQSRH